VCPKVAPETAVVTTNTAIIFARYHSAQSGVFIAPLWPIRSLLETREGCIEPLRSIQLRRLCPASMRCASPELLAPPRAPPPPPAFWKFDVALSEEGVITGNFKPSSHLLGDE
jgi:hypothetical protein